MLVIGAVGAVLGFAAMSALWNARPNTQLVAAIVMVILGLAFIHVGFGALLAVGGLVLMVRGYARGRG
jgi:hypothetical protein